MTIQEAIDNKTFQLLSADVQKILQEYITTSSYCNYHNIDDYYYYDGCSRTDIPIYFLGILSGIKLRHNRSRKFTDPLDKKRAVSSIYIKNPDYEVDPSIIKIPRLKDSSLYSKLTICDILEASFKNHSKTFEIAPDDVKKELEKLELSIKEKEDSIYSSLTIDDVEFIKRAAKIRNFLLYSDSATHIVSRYSEEELVPLSMLLSILWGEYPTNSVYSKIQGFINENSTLNLNIDVSDYNMYLSRKKVEDEYIIYPIEFYYKKYYERGSYDYEGDTIAIEMIENALVPKFTQTKANTISKILTDFNMDINKLEQLKRYVTNSIDDDLNSAYEPDLNKINTKTKDFIELVGKTYILLKENEKIMALCRSDENELYEIALFIATYYNDTTLREYLEFKGYTLQSLLKQSNIEFSGEVIDSIDFNNESLETFIKEKVLQKYNHKVENLTTDHLIKPILSTETLHNGILGVILRPLNTDHNTNIFLESKQHKRQVEDRESEFRREQEENQRQQEEQRENERRDKLSQEIFGDCSEDVYRYMRLVAIVHKEIAAKYPDMDIEQVKAVSLLISAHFLEYETDKCKEAGDLLSHLEITSYQSKTFNKYYHTIEEYMNNSSTKADVGIDIDIDIIEKYYLNYLFNGYNRGCNKQDITPVNIIKNIFSNDVNNSIKTRVFIDELSAKNSVSEVTIAEWEQKKQAKKRADEEKKRVKQFKGQMVEIFNPHRIDPAIGHNAYCLPMIYDIYKYLEKNNISCNNKEQLFQLAIIISSFYAPDNGRIRNALIRNGLTAKELLSKYNIDYEEIDKLAKNDTAIIEIYSAVYEQVLERYAKDESLYNISPKYLKAAKNYKPDVGESFREVIVTILNEKENIIEVLLQDEEQYNRLKTEITTGKTYEETLPIEDKIAILNQTPIERVDTSSAESILQFGKSLQNASKLMQSELMEALKKDTIDEATASILEVTNSMVPKSPQRGFIKIFRRQDSQGLPNISQESIDVLSNKIEKILDDLKKELSLYIQLRSYHVIHSQKIEEHYQALLIEKARLEAELTKQKENNNVIEESQLKTLLDIVMHKLHNFVVSKGIDSQAIARIDLAIATHARTIITLELAQNSIFPLIASEYIISDGVNTERNASTTVRGLIGLFNSLLTQNLKAAAENMQLLPSASISNDQIGIISETAANIIQQLEDGTQKTKK